MRLDLRGDDVGAGCCGDGATFLATNDLKRGGGGGGAGCCGESSSSTNHLNRGGAGAGCCSSSTIHLNVKSHGGYSQFAVTSIAKINLGSDLAFIQ